MTLCIKYDNAQMIELEKERKVKAAMCHIKGEKKSPNCTTQH